MLSCQLPPLRAEGSNKQKKIECQVPNLLRGWAVNAPRPPAAGTASPVVPTPSVPAPVATTAILVPLGGRGGGRRLLLLL